MKRIAVAQAPSLPGQLDRNTRQAEDLISAAADNGADIVVLPELFLCGYDIAGIARDPSTYVVSPDGLHCQRIAQKAADCETAVIVGAAIATATGTSNAALVFAPDGTIVHCYHKAKLWGDEAKVFVPGAGPVVVDLAGTRIGLAICFDAGFPEHTRALALAGADVIACPAAFAKGAERHRYEIYFASRALENTLVVAVSNAVGLQGGLEMFGESALFDPWGREIARVAGTTGFETTLIDKHEIARAREELPYLALLDSNLTKVPIIEWS